MGKKSHAVELAHEHMHGVLEALNVDMDDPNFADTPKRFVKYLREFMNHINPEDLLKSRFPVGEDYHGIVIQSNIPFRAVCAHHLLPFTGNASVGYIPTTEAVGLSKITRLVDAVATQHPSIQEAICDEVADIMNKVLKPAGVIVNIHAEHGCMACRGINKPNVITTTSSIRGVFRDNAQARAEFFELVKMAHITK